MKNANLTHLDLSASPTRHEDYKKNKQKNPKDLNENVLRRGSLSFPVESLNWKANLSSLGTELSIVFVSNRRRDQKVGVFDCDTIVKRLNREAFRRSVR